jgi:hypothetical protein
MVGMVLFETNSQSNQGVWVFVAKERSLYAAMSLHYSFPKISRGKSGGQRRTGQPPPSSTPHLSFWNTMHRQFHHFAIATHHPCNSYITMSSNVGLSTPRGSGTSGYVQKNRSLLKPREKAAPYPQDWEKAKHRPRQPDPEILEHERKREIEVKVVELRDKLEDEGYDAPCLASHTSLGTNHMQS